MNNNSLENENARLRAENERLRKGIPDLDRATPWGGHGSPVPSREDMERLERLKAERDAQAWNDGRCRKC